MDAAYQMLQRLLHDEDGPTATEYGVLLAVICIAVLGAMGLFGQRVEAIYAALQGPLSVF